MKYIVILLVLLFSTASNAAWVYEKEKDDMTGKETFTATAVSSNTHDLHWPYGKGVTARLMLRKHARYGNDVILAITAGQILCRSYEPCEIMVRFDEKSPTRMSAVGPSDNSTTAIFIRGYGQFVKRLQSATTVRIEIPLYQDGNRSFSFNVKGLDFGDKPNTAGHATKKPPGAANGNTSAAVALAKSKNCMACHNIDKRTIGPAYIDVAKKYKGDSDAAGKLAAKIREGGSGVWGPIPMPPNPNVTTEEARRLAAWILGIE